MKETLYQYKNLPIPGGGYVTGFMFHPEKENVLYIRTDIGGSYKFDYDSQRWEPLNESVSMIDLSESFPIALAVDPQRPEMLYIASGINDSKDENGKPWGKLSVSWDYGQSFVHRKIPCYVHGNRNGRGTGTRLVRDISSPDTLYFASQEDGLLRTRDLGITWEKIEINGERYMTFVWCSADGKTLIVGTAGVSTGSMLRRGHSLYISYDGGENFVKIPMPRTAPSDSKWRGYVAHRYDYDGTYFYCTLVNTGKNSYVTDMGYSCDSGDLTDGRILRFAFDEQGHIGEYEDITPCCEADADGVYEVEREQFRDYGFGGISSCAAMPGLLASSTLCRDIGDMVLISLDYGQSWQVALFDLSVGKMDFKTSYMKPAYNGNHSLIHWLSDIKINPFCPDEVWFNTGTGVFVSRYFTTEDRCFQDCCEGIEQTVHLNVYGTVDGPVKVLDIVGDLGGFAFRELDQPCENSFADRQGNRYITCINADFSDKHPGMVIATPRGNWKGKTKGGLIFSRDHGLNFDRIPLPYGISPYLDKRFDQIEQPNVNSGWAALSADGNAIVYGVAEGIELYAKGVIVSVNGGASFDKSYIYDYDGNDISDSEVPIKIFSDRTDPNRFYGFGNGLSLFISKDKGRHFDQTSRALFPETLCLGLIDCANKTEIRGESGKRGVFYAALGSYGLWKICFPTVKKPLSQPEVLRLTKEKEIVYRVGLGLLSPGSDYLKDDKALYICGVIDGIYGFFRSVDDGKSWEKINQDTQQFGDINSIDGDCHEFGRYYIATGSFGLKYGEPVDQMDKSIIRGNRKTVSFSFDKYLNLVVKVPSWLSDDEIDRIIEKKSRWIENTRNRLKNAKREEMRTRLPLENGDRMPYLGQQLILTVVREPRKRGKVSLNKDRLLMWVPYHADYEFKKSCVVAWYRKQAAYVIEKKARAYAEKMGVTYHEIHIKDQRTRWGSCSGMKNLNFTWRLVMMPDNVCDYVIIHELCHLVHMDHSPEFWKLVEKMCPPYKQQKKWLRENGNKLYFI